MGYELMRFPEQHFSIIILANRDDADPTGLSYQIADLFLSDEFEMVSKELKVVD